MSQFALSATLLEKVTQFVDEAEAALRRGDTRDSPLHAFRRCWNFWWASNLSVDDQQALEGMAAGMSEVAREEFVGRLRQELIARYKDAGAAALVLMQLADLPLFQSWRALGSHRQSRAKAVQALVLHHTVGGDAEDVLPFVVILLERKADEPVFQCCGFVAGDVVFGNAYSAVRSLLGAGMFRALLFGCFSGWTTPRPLVRVSVSLGWLAVFLGLLSTYLFGANWAHDLVASVLVVALLVSIVLALRILVACAREVTVAWRTRGLLARSQFYVVAGNREEAEVRISGSSFGLALAVGMLAALLDTVRPGSGSWLWQSFNAKLNRDHSFWAFSADLQPTGLLAPVERVRDKHKACVDHRRVRHLVIPFQDRHLPTVCVRPQLGIASAYGEAAVADSLRLHRCWHLATVVLKLGNVVSGWAVLVSLLALLSTAAFVKGYPEIRRILSHSPQVKTAPDWSEEVPFRDPAFRLVLRTTAPDDFRLRLSSEGRALPLRLPLDRDFHHPLHAKVDVPLSTFTNAFGADSTAWWLEIVRPQSFLGRRLRDVIVLQVPYVGIRQEAEDANRRLFPENP